MNFKLSRVSCVSSKTAKECQICKHLSRLLLRGNNLLWALIACILFQGPKSFVFKSDDFETNPNLCVLIHGSGVVRAGQWARRLLMNENLDLGTIMPDIMMAKERGFAVLVMNTNDNTR